MEARRDVFQAIADPTRRQIIGMLSDKPMNLTKITDDFDMTRQAITLHIKILEECGLITVTKEGREKTCQVKLDQLSEVYEWAEQYKKFWSLKIAALKTFVEQESPKADKNKKSKS